LEIVEKCSQLTVNLSVKARFGVSDFGAAGQKLHVKTRFTGSYWLSLHQLFTSGK
jgi:hypothetical protein